MVYYYIDSEGTLEYEKRKTPKKSTCSGIINIVSHLVLFYVLILFIEHFFYGKKSKPTVLL